MGTGKTYFNDQHDNPIVIKYRNEFIARLKKLIQMYESMDNILGGRTTTVSLNGRRTIIIVR